MVRAERRASLSSLLAGPLPSVQRAVRPAGIEPAPRAWHARILPLDHGRVRCAGIEPASKRWERFILPLNEHRAASAVGESGFSAGRAWSRPTETPGSPIHQVA